MRVDRAYRVLSHNVMVPSGPFRDMMAGTSAFAKLRHRRQWRPPNLQLLPVRLGHIRRSRGREVFRHSSGSKRVNASRMAVHRFGTVQGFGYVPMRTYRSVKDAALMGYKDKLLWFTTDGNQFDSYLACDEGAYAAVTSMLRTYANQRPPESR